MKRAIAIALLLAVLTAAPAAASSSQARQVLSVAMDQLGAPYELHPDAPDSFNCLTFVLYCFNKVKSGTLSEDGVSGGYSKVSSIKNLKAGDIVFFKSSSRLKGILGYHFAIYMGKGCIIHAANKDTGVTVSRIKDYKKRFVGAIRVF